MQKPNEIPKQRLFSPPVEQQMMVRDAQKTLTPFFHPIKSDARFFLKIESSSSDPSCQCLPFTRSASVLLNGRVCVGIADPNRLFQSLMQNNGPKAFVSSNELCQSSLHFDPMMAVHLKDQLLHIRVRRIFECCGKHILLSWKQGYNGS